MRVVYVSGGRFVFLGRFHGKSDLGSGFFFYLFQERECSTIHMMLS